VLLGFKAQHRVTGKFYTVWAEDDADARVRISGYLKVPLNEILRALPSQAMGPDAIRFDPKAAAPPPGVPSTPEKTVLDAQLPWQFPTHAAASAVSGKSIQPQQGVPASPLSYSLAKERSYNADYGSIARPIQKIPFHDRDRHQVETSTASSGSEERDSPSSSPTLVPSLK
jgi:hypothetical protein